jgi:hypothetical protein
MAARIAKGQPSKSEEQGSPLRSADTIACRRLPALAQPKWLAVTAAFSPRSVLVLVRIYSRHGEARCYKFAAMSSVVVLSGHHTRTDGCSISVFNSS